MKINEIINYFIHHKIPLIIRCAIVLRTTEKDYMLSVVRGFLISDMLKCDNM